TGWHPPCCSQERHEERGARCTNRRVERSERARSGPSPTRAVHGALATSIRTDAGAQAHGGSARRGDSDLLSLRRRSRRTLPTLVPRSGRAVRLARRELAIRVRERLRSPRARARVDPPGAPALASPPREVEGQDSSGQNARPDASTAELTTASSGHTSRGFSKKRAG